MPTVIHHKPNAAFYKNFQWGVKDTATGIVTGRDMTGYTFIRADLRAQDGTLIKRFDLTLGGITWVTQNVGKFLLRLDDTTSWPIANNHKIDVVWEKDYKIVTKTFYINNEEGITDVA